jgi:acetoin utilization deacetylase AcuC-like enzyme
MRVWYCDHFEVPLPPGHRFPMSKYAALRRQLMLRGLVHAGQFEASVTLSRGALFPIHSEAYVERCFAGTWSEEETRRIGFPWSQALLHRSLASAHGTLAAARHALGHGFAANLAGGTHHAFFDGGSGYCVFNDLALAAKTLLNEGLVQRVLIVDLDVHQGDGTAALCADEPRIFTFSMHGEKNFPFRKQRSSRDVPLEDGIDDAAYLELLDRNLTEVMEAADPQVLLYQAGVDVLKEDALGRLALTVQGVGRRDRLVFECAKARGVPLAMTLGGGYAKPVSLSLDAHCETYRQAAKAFG